MVDVAQRLARLSPAQRQLLEARLKDNPKVSQPIAIVGMACRLPGASNLDAFWRLIQDRRCAVTEIPADRWDLERYYDTDPDTPGKMSIRWGAFVDRVSEFDSMFFGITPREAVRMDPQQRLLLEVAWEAFENSGISPEQLAGSATGVFVGIGGNDYSKLPNGFDNYLEYIDAHMGTGNALSVAANRISYIMDLRGPSIAVDTACSSGSVGVHLAVQSLRNGECDSAIAGAVNLILSPEVTIAFSKARMLSQTGQCRPFDAGANGYVRGEGCGMVVLKRLTDATRDGDNILAIIRGTAVNQDGRTSGISAPNSLSQIACIRSALSVSGIDASQVSYVEAHGTGTPLGDPIEFQSLTKLFAKRSDDDQPVHVTSVKANVGHTETVSGIAGLMKVILMMKHRVIPGQTGLEELNPNIHLDGTRLRIPREEVPWTTTGTLVAGVSSFGFGGTNSHLIIESSSSPTTPSATEAQLGLDPAAAIRRPKCILAMSAKSKRALPQLASSYADRLEQLSDTDVADFCFSANVGRAHFNLRTAMIAKDREELIAQLRTVGSGERLSSKIKSSEVRIASKPRVAFLYSGQGSQFTNMAKSLYDEHPIFRQHFDECAQILAEQRDQSLLDVVFPVSGKSPLDETEYTQPALFALEYALTKLWRSWGVEPSILLGHSVGEYVAACVAGVFSLEDGLRLIAKRAELMQRLPQDGTMAVIFATRDRVEQTLRPFGEQVAIATANGPENNVISGKTEIVQQIVAEFEKAGVGTQLLNVSHAFHSPLMDPMLDEFEAFAAGIVYSRPTIPIVANRTGKLVDTAEFDAAYWRDHIRNSVEFATGMQVVHDHGVHAMLEIGPSSSLLGMGRRCLPESDAVWVPSLRKGRDDWDTILAAVSELYVLGVSIDWRGFDRPWKRKRLAVPNYPFQRSRHWLIDDTKPVISGGGRGPSVHPLLGSRVVTAHESQLYEARFSADNPKYMRDHQVQGSVVVPAAAYIEQGLALAQLQFGDGFHAVEDIAIQHALFLPVEGHRIMQVSSSPEMGGRIAFETYSISGDSVDTSPKWQLHVNGSVVHADAVHDGDRPERIDVDDVIRRKIRDVSRAEFYETMSARNLVYGQAFQVLGATVRTECDAISELILPESIVKDLDKYHLHPALGDALMQTVAATVPLEPNGEFTPYTYVPVRVRRVRVWGPPQKGVRLYAKRISLAEHPSPEAVESNVYLLDADDKPLVEFAGVVVQRVGKAITAPAVADIREWLFDIDWKPQPIITSQPTSLEGRVLIFADDAGIAQELAQVLHDFGGDVILVRPGTTYQSTGNSFVIRPTEASDYQTLLREVMANAIPLRHVMHLWAVDAPGIDRLDVAALQHVKEQTLVSLLLLTQQLARINAAKPPRLWTVTRGAQGVAREGKASELVHPSQTAIWGMGRVATMEHPELGVHLIDFSPQAASRDVAEAMIAELQANENESQVAFRDGQRYVARLVTKSDRLPSAVETSGLRIPSGSPYRLRITEAGSFDSLEYEAFTPAKPGPHQVALEVKSAGLNFSDVLKALGLYPGITDAIVPMGIEASGIVTQVGSGVDRFAVGDEVMGVVPFSFASHAMTADYALVKKPNEMEHDEASTIPVTFLTAYYALVRLAQLQPGERVLIHAGAGGVGQAAIQIAQHLKAKIFCTAGSDEKREFLHSLGVEHVFNSRTLEFAKQIREITGREGVDVVLNSLPGDAITESLRLLKAYGRFLEIGKTDIYSNTMIGLLPFQDNLSYFAIDLDRMLRQRPDYIRTMFGEMMEYFRQEIYRPMPYTRFDVERTVDAFRYMAQRKNIGKVVVGFDAVHQSESDQVEKFRARKDGTYLITGGLGALGLQVARWLAEHDAGFVVLMSRRQSDESTHESVEKLRGSGVEVAIVQGDVADRKSLEASLAQIPSDFPPLRGIVHAAGVLADGVMFDMGLDQLNKPLLAKIDGAWNLHQLTEGMSLDFLVLFSSVASILGSPGQANYAAGNAFLDGLADLRSQQGLPTVSINWGPWADSGMAKDAGIEAQLASRGMGMLPSHQALDLLGDLIQTGQPRTAVMSVNWTDMVRASGGAVQSLLRDITASIDLGASGGDSAEDRALRKSLQGLEVVERKNQLTEFFASQLASIMGMEVSEIDVVQPLNAMGLDSLMAIELKNKIESKLQLSLPMAVFMNEPSVVSLADYVAENFTGGDA